MTVGDIIDWPVEFGPIDAEIECRPVDVKAISNAVFRDSAAILGVNDAGIWVRSEAVRQGRMLIARPRPSRSSSVRPRVLLRYTPRRLLRFDPRRFLLTLTRYRCHFTVND